MRYMLLSKEQVYLRNIKEIASVNRDNNLKTTKRLED
jgi:hypothetical protein